MNPIKFGSVCSGIEAASVAWLPLGWKAAWLSEIEPFPSAVLAHHYPDVQNLGDMTKLPERIKSGEVEAPDVFCGGTPCQAFSVAGLRKSLDDARGNLSLVFCEIADELDAARLAGGKPETIIFWENVPGVLSTKDNAFGCFLAGLAGEDQPLEPPGGKWTNAGAVLGPKRAVAWRVLDAQYFGVAQRRRRVFVVASARAGFDPAAVLFEFDGVRRDSAPRREAGEGAAGGAGASIAGGIDYEGNCHLGNEPTGPLLKGSPTGGGHPLPAVITMAHGQGGAEIGFDRGPTLTCNHEAPIAAYSIHPHCIGRAPNAGPQGKEYLDDGSAYCMDSRGQPQAVAHPIPFDTTQITSPANFSSHKAGDPCHPLAAGAHVPAIAVSLRGQEGGATAELGDEVGNCLRASGGGGDKAHVLAPVVDTLYNKGIVTLKEGNASTQETYPGTLLRALRQEVGAEAFAKWGLGILDSLQQAEVLRQALHGTRIRRASGEKRLVLDDGSLPRPEDLPAGAMRSLWEDGPDGCSPQGRELAKQLARELGAPLPFLPHEGAQKSGMMVRRLTPVECSRLQGFPDDYLTQVPWRGKVPPPDGPRYKALGNSWAVPNVRWIGRRIDAHLRALDGAIPEPKQTEAA